MSDYTNAALNVKTALDGDIVAKLGDATNPSQQLAISASGEASIQVTQPLPAGDNNIGNVDVVSQPARSHSTDSIKVGDGTDFLAVNNDGSINAVVSATDLDIRNLSSASDSVTVVATDLDVRDLNSATDSVTAVATDLDIRDLSHTTDSVKVGDGTDFLAISAAGAASVSVVDPLPAGTNLIGKIEAHLKDESGNAFTLTNPLPVSVVEGADADAIAVHNGTTNTAVDGTSNHDYTVNASKLFLLKEVAMFAFGRMKVEIQAETAAGSNTFTTVAVTGTSAAFNSKEFMFATPVEVVAGARVRVIRTNKDNQQQDLHTSIIGEEIPA